MADNAEPKVLVRRVRMPAVYAVERISEQVWILSPGAEARAVPTRIRHRTAGSSLGS